MPTDWKAKVEEVLVMGTAAKARFDRFIVIDGACWKWTSRINNRGYGTFWLNGATRFAHRVSYSTFCRPLIAGEILDHLCRTPACVNPDHLEVVTYRENTLRGDGPTAINARKTRCLNGHNDWRSTAKGRVCRRCQTLWMRRHRAAQRNQSPALVIGGGDE